MKQVERERSTLKEMRIGRRNLPMLKSLCISRLFKLWILPAGLLGGVFSLTLILYSSTAIRHASSERLYSSADTIPERHAALVLGCTKTLANGRPNLYFKFRIEAAADLYQKGKCQYLIVSGDNSHESYDEPTDMAEALVARGVPENRIFKDYAGFRTLDSVVRSREIFGQDQIVVVSQPFHNARAIYIARENGIDAIGFNARKMDRYRAVKTKLREQLARVKTVLDAKLLGTTPKFLGPPVIIPENPKSA